MKKAELERRAAELAGGPYLKVTQGEPSEGFLASVPELPGYFTVGATEDEALSNLREAMTAWLMTALDDGDSIPSPSCAAGADRCLVLRLSPQLGRRLHELARAEGLSDEQLALGLRRSHGGLSSEQRATSNEQRATGNGQRSAGNQQGAASNERRATRNAQ